MGSLIILPLEIQDVIFCHLSFHDRWRMSGVCKAWRSAMLNWHGMWESLSTDNYPKIPDDLLPYRAYIQGKWVRRIHADTIDIHYSASYYRSYNHGLEPVVDFLFAQKCTAIQEVDFTSDGMSPPAFSNLITLCGESLTSLCLDFFGGVELEITPCIVLSHFPNLIRLQYIGAPSDITQWNPTEFDGLKHQNLLDLTLEISEADGELASNGILFATPCLRRLRLNLQCMEAGVSELASILTEHCPNLTTLVLASCDNAELITHGDDLEWNFDASTSTTTDNNSDDQSRLRHLVLHDPFDNHYETTREILRLIIPLCHRTLQTLDLMGAHELHGGEIMEWVSTEWVFPSLQRLSLTNDRGTGMMTYSAFDLDTFAANKSAPKLKSLKLQGLDSDMSGLNALASDMPSLRELHLEDCPEIPSCVLNAFFFDLSEVQTSQTEQDQLAKVTLRDMPGVDSSVVCRIVFAFGAGLEELVIHGCDYLDFDEVTALFFDNGAGFSKEIQRIQRLDLKFVYHNSMFYFPSHPSTSPRVYPDESTVQEALCQLDAKCLEWRLELADVSRHKWEPDVQVFDHITYRKEKLASSKQKTENRKRQLQKKANSSIVSATA